jgi:hypothetical protein
MRAERPSRPLASQEAAQTEDSPEIRNPRIAVGRRGLKACPRLDEGDEDFRASMSGGCDGNAVALDFKPIAAETGQQEER